MKEAGVEMLAAVKGIGKKRALQIFEAFKDI